MLQGPLVAAAAPHLQHLQPVTVLSQELLHVAVAAHNHKGGGRLQLLAALSGNQAATAAAVGRSGSKKCIITMMVIFKLLNLTLC